MKLLQVNTVSRGAIADVADSFTRLPHTNHKDGKFRLRRYSAIELRTSFWNAKEEAVVKNLNRSDFMQEEEWNKHQGGMTRNFEQIEEGVLQSEGLKEMLLLYKNEFGLIDGQEVEIHQMRVATLGTSPTPVAPEGVHQDGYDYIGMIGIARHNIIGGNLMVSKDKDSTPFLDVVMEDGQMFMVADDVLWHNAKPITMRDKNGGQGNMDLFVFTARA